MRQIIIVKYRCKICGEVRENCRINPARYVDPELVVVGLKMFGMWKQICEKCHAKNTIKRFRRAVLK